MKDERSVDNTVIAIVTNYQRSQCRSRYEADYTMSVVYFFSSSLG